MTAKEINFLPGHGTMEHGSTNDSKTQIQKNMDTIIASWQTRLMKLFPANKEPMQIAVQLLHKYFPEPQFDLSSLKPAADIIPFAVKGLFPVILKAMTECSEVNRQNPDADGTCASYTLRYLDKILEDLKNVVNAQSSIEGSKDQTPEKKPEENFKDLRFERSLGPSSQLVAWSGSVEKAHREFGNIVLILKTMVLEKMENEGTHNEYSMQQYTEALAKGEAHIDEVVTMLEHKGGVEQDRKIVADAMVGCYLGPSCQSLESLGSTTSQHLQTAPPTASRLQPPPPTASQASHSQSKIKLEDVSNNAINLK